MTKSLTIRRHTKNSKAHELTRKKLTRCLTVSCVHNHEMCTSVSHQENASPITDYYQGILTRKARTGKTNKNVEHVESPTLPVIVNNSTTILQSNLVMIYTSKDKSTL